MQIQRKKIKTVAPTVDPKVVITEVSLVANLVTQNTPEQLAKHVIGQALVLKRLEDYVNRDSQVILVRDIQKLLLGEVL